MHKSIKRCLFGMSLFSLFLVAGCGKPQLESLDEQTAFNAVERRNIDLIQRLETTGVITKESSEKKQEMITANMGALKKAMAAVREGQQDKYKTEIAAFRGAISGVMNMSQFKDVPTIECGCVDGCSGHQVTGYWNESLEEGTYIADATQITGWSDLDQKIDSGALNPVAYEILDDKNLQSLKSETEGKIYVLKPTVTQEEIEQVLYQLHLAKQNQTANKSDSELYNIRNSILMGNKFEPVVGKDNQPMPLFDFSVYDNPDEANGSTGVLCETKPYDNINDILGRRSAVADFDNTVPNRDVIVTGRVGIKKHVERTEKAKDGTESCACYWTDGQPYFAVYSIRIKEFNEDFIRTVEKNFNTTDKFYKLPGSSSNTENIYLLMEYPVEVIDSISMSGTKWKANWKFSNHMYVNIYSGEMLYKTYDDTTQEWTSVVINNEESVDDRLYMAAMYGDDTNTSSIGQQHFSFVVGEQPVNLRTVDTSTVALEDVVQVTLGDPINKLSMDDIEGHWFVSTFSYSNVRDWASGPSTLQGALKDTIGDSLKYDPASHMITDTTTQEKTGLNASQGYEIELARLIGGQENKIPLMVGTDNYFNQYDSMIPKGKYDARDARDFVAFFNVFTADSSNYKSRIKNLYNAINLDTLQDDELEGMAIYRVLKALPWEANTKAQDYLSDYTILRLIANDIDVTEATGYATYRKYAVEDLWDFWYGKVSDLDLDTYKEDNPGDNGEFQIYFKDAPQDGNTEKGNEVLRTLGFDDEYINTYQKYDFNRQIKFILARSSAVDTSVYHKVIFGTQFDSTKLTRDADTGEMTYEYNGILYEVENPQTKAAPAEGSFLDRNGNIRVDVQTVAFRLTDYLELTYMPGAAMDANGGVLDDEPFIATGRRITLTKLASSREDKEVSLDEVVGYYGNKYGNPMEINDGTSQVKLGDIIDYTSGAGDYEEVGLKLNAQKGKVVPPQTVLDASGNYAEAFHEAGVTGRLSSVTGEVLDRVQLQYEMHNDTINPVIQFTSVAEDPKPALDGCDYGRIREVNPNGEEIKPSMYYGICIYTNPYETGLYIQWIDLDEARAKENGCLKWWNSWLAEHNYYYSIDVENLKQMINGIYAITFAKLSSDMTFRQDVIEVINKENRKQDDTKLVRLIRTVEILMGIFFIFYGLLLQVAWIIDINITDGPGFLRILTLDKLYAVDSWDTDLPRSYEGHVNADFKYLIVLTLLFVIIGIFLIIFDLPTIANMLISFVKRLMEFFTNVINRRR